MIGKKISHYQIVEKLGEGGMGVVYKAEDTKLERTVALKFLPSDAVGSEEDKTRFVSEARAAAALDHPNICTVYEINEADGQQYIAMAYIEGVSLRDKIDERPLKIDELLGIAVQVAGGLREAHEKGIVHRDIKSANIMIDKQGRVKIMDFGLADRGDSGHGPEEESTLGTVAYSSPEQVSGSPMDARTDIWSFGVTLYEMATGQLPFRGDYEQAIVYSILNETPEPVTGMRTGVPVELERIINKALAKNADERYQYMDEMLFDLKSLRDELDPSRSGSTSGTVTRPVYGRETSFFRKMLDRHVFPVLAVYLAVIWGTSRLMDWIVDQLVLSPHWTSITTVALVLFIPTVFLLAYFRGARVYSSWTRTEKIGIPVNLLLAGFVLALVFHGKDIGAATRTVAVETEDGEKIERVVPKNEFRKNLKLFVFENASGDPALDWLQYSLPLMLEYDMIQDQYLDLNSAFDRSAYEKLKNAGFSTWHEAPLALKRKIAREAHRDFFVNGSYRLENGEYVVDVQLYGTNAGRVAAENTVRNANLFSLCDELSVMIKHDMDVPDGYLEETTDLAVEEMLTSSVEAARYIGEAQAAVAFDQNWQRAVELFEAAVDADSTMAYAHFSLAQTYLQNNQSEKGSLAYEKAMRYVYKIPERMQFVVKANYYFFKQESEKAFAVLKMMAELYPADVFGHLGLAQIYQYRNELDLAIAEYEKVVELDPGQYDFLHTIGDLAVQLGDNEKALSYYNRFAELNPQNADAFTKLGDFYRETGDYDSARENYEKALLVDPARVSIQVDLADIEDIVGNSDDALAQYRAALDASRSSEDKIRAHHSLRAFFVKHGRINEAIEQMKLEQAERAATSSPLMAQMQKVSDVDLYAMAGRPEEGFAVMDDVKSQLTPPFDKIMAIGFTKLYIELGQADEAEKALEQFEEYLSSYKIELLRPMSHRFRGRIAELRGDPEAAIAEYQRRVELAPTEYSAYRDMGRCYRKLAQYDKARENLLKMAKLHPYDPKTNYELALVYNATGDRTRATDHMNRALKTWESADDVYAPAHEARKTADSWRTAQ